MKSSSEGLLILSQLGGPEVSCTKLPAPLEFSHFLGWFFFFSLH